MEYFDSEIGLYINIFFRKGIPYPYCILKEKFYDQISAYYSLEIEINACVEAINTLSKIKNEHSIPQIIKDSLLFSTIVRYAKCFNTAEGRGSSLDSAKIFSGVNKKYLGFHSKIMDARNTYLAHAGIGEYESRAVIVHLSPDPNDRKVEGVIYTEKRMIAKEVKYEYWVEIFMCALQHIKQKIKKALNQLDIQIGKIPIDQLYAISKVPIVNENSPN